MEKNIIDYFEKTVRKYPENIAVSDQYKEMTYRELKRNAEQLAWQLREFTECPIAIYLERRVELTVAILAVLYSGNFYIVLDKDSPKDRIEKILNTAKPVAIIGKAEKNLAEGQLLDENIRWIEFEEKFEHLEQEKIEKLAKKRADLCQETPAYGLFTSGSTGDPKGVLVTHGNVIAYIGWFTECFEIDEKTSFGSQTPLYFSMSVSDFYGSMFTGAAYHMIPKEYFAFPAKLVEYINEKKVNAIYWVPSAMGIVVKWDLFKYAKPLYMEKIMFAGETMPVKYLNYWRKYLENAVFANLFGPTETTDICTYYRVDREFQETESLPIGRACENCQLIIADKGVEVKKGQIGQLYVKSPFVAKGYYRNPEKTKEAFVQNPLHDDYIDIVYNTGDLVCENQEGLLEYKGRKDYQIKHMGYRIELGEIESVLNGSINDIMTVCIYDENKDKLILAYEAKGELEDQLRNISSMKLPVYMQPEEYKKLDCLPINANGKIDRKEIKKFIEMKGN